MATISFRERVLTARRRGPIRAATGAAWILAAFAANAAEATQEAFPLADPPAFLARLDALLYEELVEGADAPPPKPEWELAVLQSSLPRTSAILALWPDGDVTWGAVVRSGAVRVRELKTPHTPIMAQRLHDWMDDPSTVAFDPQAAQLLYNNLFPPFREDLAGIRHLIVAAGGVLRSIPFETLLLGEVEDVPESELPFLVGRFECSYEATLGSRLCWSARRAGLRRLPLPDSDPLPPGSLVIRGPGDQPDGLLALRWARSGARGALLGAPDEAIPPFLRSFLREQSGGRRPDVRAHRRVQLEALKAQAPPAQWAFPRLFGAR